MYVSGNYAYVADYSSGLKVVHLNDPVTNISVNEETDTITATFPANLIQGSYHVLVTNPGGQSEEGRLNDGFTVFCPDVDSDEDGTLDCNDKCPDDPDKTETGECGCGEVETGDTDGDGTHDCHDNCPLDDNTDQADRDCDNIGDACDKSPTTLEVGAGKCYTKIQDALDAAQSGDTVLVYEDTYRENLIFPDKSITVRSVGGPEKTIIDGDLDNDGTGDGRVVEMFSGGDYVLEGFTIQRRSAFCRRW